MADDVKRRAYRSERRREQAQQTRERVLDAAAAVFAERGYERTTIAALAGAAGVSPESVYSHFGNKRTLIGELAQRSVRGREQGPVGSQSGPQAVLAASDQREQLRLFANDVVRRLERAAPVLAVVAAAAPGDAELAELYERLHEDRLRNLRLLVDALARNGSLRLDAQRATETVWAVASPELYRLMTGVRGWSRRRYADWIVATLEALLLG